MQYVYPDSTSYINGACLRCVLYTICWSRHAIVTSEWCKTLVCGKLLLLLLPMVLPTFLELKKPNLKILVLGLVVNNDIHDTLVTCLFVVGVFSKCVVWVGGNPGFAMGCFIWKPFLSLSMIAIHVLCNYSCIGLVLHARKLWLASYTHVHTVQKCITVYL